MLSASAVAPAGCRLNMSEAGRQHPRPHPEERSAASKHEGISCPWVGHGVGEVAAPSRESRQRPRTNPLSMRRCPRSDSQYRSNCLKRNRCFYFLTGIRTKKKNLGLASFTPPQRNVTSRIKRNTAKESNFKACWNRHPSARDNSVSRILTNFSYIDRKETALLTPCSFVAQFRLPLIIKWRISPSTVGT